MVKITKVYTRMGDTGETHLGGGARVSKDSARIEAIGDVDELNAMVGFVVSALELTPVLENLKTQCLQRQQELFNLGAQLAVLPALRRPNTPILHPSMMEQLEKEIDAYNQSLPPLQSFILPGGGEVGARFHLARTVCRRAERTILKLAKQEQNLDGTEIPYLNRLSDWLFVAARFSALKMEVNEMLWQP